MKYIRNLDGSHARLISPCFASECFASCGVRLSVRGHVGNGRSVLVRGSQQRGDRGLQKLFFLKHIFYYYYYCCHIKLSHDTILMSSLVIALRFVWFSKHTCTSPYPISVHLKDVWKVSSSSCVVRVSPLEASMRYKMNKEVALWGGSKQQLTPLAVKYCKISEN